MTSTESNQFTVPCPECGAIGMIHIPATADTPRYHITCPTCEGEKYLPTAENEDE